MSAVTDKPIITMQSQTITRLEGGTVNLACTADGNPIPNINWRTLDGSETSNAFTMQNISRMDMGYYACVARNMLTPSGEDPVNETVTENVFVDVQCKY